MISVVCVYNDEQTLQDCLLQCLRSQTASCELIALDNTESRFRSAAEALNYGGGRAHGKYVMFVHQDVSLNGDTWMRDAENVLDSLPELGVAGIAGKRKKNEWLSNSKHGTPPRPAGSETLGAPVVVQTVDECLVVVPREVFDVLKFDEAVCDGWHLYAVDYCLSSASIGLKTYVLPLPVYHSSEGAVDVPTHLLDQLTANIPASHRGNLSPDYYKTLKKLLKKHRNQTPRVYTTFRDWTTAYPIIVQRVAFVVVQIVNSVRTRLYCV